MKPARKIKPRDPHAKALRDKLFQPRRVAVKKGPGSYKRLGAKEFLRHVDFRG